MNEEKIKTSIIFTGLTRPTMHWGVTADFFMLNAMFSMCVFVVMKNPFYLIVGIPIHVIGWLLCKKDQNMFCILIKLIDCLPSQNNKLWGCKSYEPF